MLRGLGSVRDDWDLRWDMETQLIQSLTVKESAFQLEALYREFHQELLDTEHLFASKRMESMAQLQARLGKLES